MALRRESQRVKLLWNCFKVLPVKPKNSVSLAKQLCKMQNSWVTFKEAFNYKNQGFIILYIKRLEVGMCTVAKFISLWTSGLCACSLRFSRFLPHGHKAAASTLCTVFLYHGIQKHNVRMDTSLCVYFDQGGIFPRQPSQTYSSHLTGPNWVPYQFLNHSWQVMICLRKTGYTGFECIASVSEQYPKLGFKYI